MTRHLRTVGHGAFESTFDGATVVKRAIRGSLVITHRSRLSLNCWHSVPDYSAKYEGPINFSSGNGGISAPRSQIICHELSCGSHSSGNFLLLGNNFNVYSDHKAVDISGSRVTGTMRHGAFESPFDEGPCAKASFVGAFVNTDRPTLHTKMTSWHKERQGS